MSEREAPIGVFDSGFGGLTVMRSLVDQLPNEDFVYLGDTARAPYGPRSIAQVREFALQGLDHLAERGVKALVIACNSASSAVLRDARERYDVPILEVILPAARRAVAASNSGRVGVVCTEATAMSRSYDDAFAVAGDVQLTTQACPRFVEFVEAGITGGEELLGVAREYLAPLQVAGIDTLILGCTHYPLLKPLLQQEAPQLQLVDSALTTAEAVAQALQAEGLLNDGTGQTADYRFYVSDIPLRFQTIGERFLGRSLQQIEMVSLG